MTPPSPSDRAGLVPTAMAIPGGVAPIDLALGVALPVHSHIALNFVRVPFPLVLDPRLEIRVRSEA